MKAYVSVLAPLALIASIALAQAPIPFQRTVLQQVDISVPGREAVTALAEIQPGAAAGRHTHPGEEIAYVLDGTVLVEIDGKPPATYTTGKAFMVPAGTVHNARNTGRVVARILVTYVVEKGKPLAQPVAGN